MRTRRKALSIMMFLVMLLTLVPLPEARAADSTASAAGDGVRITQTAEWNREVPGGTAARVTINVSTDMDLQKPKDVVFVVDCSALQNLSAWKSCAKTLAEYLRAVPEMRYALVSYASAPEKKLDFTTDVEALKTQVDSITKGLNSDAYAALRMAESMINSRTDKGNPACIAYFGNGRFNMNYHKTLAYGKELQARVPVYCPIGSSGSALSELNTITGSRVYSPYDAAIYIGESKVCSITVTGMLDGSFRPGSAFGSVGGGKSHAALVRPVTGEVIYTDNLTMGRSMKLTIGAELRDPALTGELPVSSSASITLGGQTVAAGAVSLDRSGYHVTYDPKDGEGKVPVDNTLYGGGTTVTLKPASLRRDGWNFSGWTHPTTGIKDGKFAITGDTTVEAAWGRAHVKLSSSTITGLTGTNMLNRSQIEALEGKAFYASTYWDNLESITIHDHVEIPADAKQTWDVTDTSGQSRAGAVMAWVTPGSSSNYFHLHIGGKGGVIAPVDCTALFRFEGSYVKKIEGLEHLDTSHVTIMKQMFASDRYGHLDTLDLSGWDTSNVTDMSEMFRENWNYGCYGYWKSLNLSGWDTSNVVDMSNMFQYCNKLQSLNLSGWDTSNVTNMSNMFDYCEKLQLPDTIGNWKTGNVTDMDYMFQNCSVATSLNLSGWETDSLQRMGYMFKGCTSLSELNVANWNVSNAQNFSGAFYNCRALSTLDLSGWNTSSAEKMDFMFSRCSELTELKLGENWNTALVTDMSNMFSNCAKLTSLNTGGWNTAKVTNTQNMFENCSSLTELDVSSWDITRNMSTHMMFSGCSSLKTLKQGPNFKTGSGYPYGLGGYNGGTTAYMFDGCSSLESLDVTNWRLNYTVEGIDAMFKGCSSLKTLTGIETWSISSVKTASSLFEGCSSLTTVDISWNAPNLITYDKMFKDCTSLERVDVSSWTFKEKSSSASSYDKFSINGIFQNCTSLTDIGTTAWALPAGYTYAWWRSGANTAMDSVKLTLGGEASSDDATTILPTAAANNSAALQNAAEEAAEETAGEPAAETGPAEPIEPAAPAEPVEPTEPAEPKQPEDTRTETLEAELLHVSPSPDPLEQLDSRGRPVYARKKIGVWDCGRVKPAQKINYSLELQYLGEDVEDHGGVSGLLTVTNPIPAGLTLVPDSLHISETAGWVDSVTPGSPVGTIVQRPAVDSNNVLTFSVTGLSMGAKFTVYYSCTAPAQAPASYIEFLNTASVDDNGLPDESDPVRHYMLAEGETDPPEKFAVSYAYDATAPEGAPAYGTVTYAAGTQVTLPQPVVPGWRFQGWKIDNAGDVVTRHTVTGTVRFVGSWTKTEIPKVKLAYSFTEPGPDSAAVIQPALLADAVTEAPENTVTSAPVLDAVPEGWTFAWKYPEKLAVASDGTFSVGHTADWPDGTIRIRGVWTRKSYDVTYVYSGAPSDAPALPSPNPQAHPWGAAVPLPPTPANTATHYFLGWTSPDITAAPNGTFPMPGKNITITGEWAKKPALAPDEHEVKVEPNGGTWRDSGLDTVLPRSEYDRMIAGQDFPDPVRNDGVEFLRWRTTSPDPDGLFDLVVTAQWKEGITAAFDVQGHGTAPETVTGLTSGDRVPKPSPDPAAPNYAFGGWFREPACTTAWRFDSDTVTNDITLYAKWLQVYQVSGTVKGPDGNPIANARVKIVHEGDETFWEDTTGADGAYTITGVPSGIYNTVATYPLSGTEEVTTTILSIIENRDLSDQVIQFAAGNTNSILTVRDMPETTPYVVVGGLEAEAASVRGDPANTDAPEVRVTMDVTPADQARNQTEIQAIRTAAEQAAARISSQPPLQAHVDLVLDVGLTKEVAGTDPEKITSAANILELVIPYPMEGKANILVHRFHSAQDDREGAVTFTRETADTASRADKTFYLDAEHGLIHVFAQKFSLYAVSYTTETPVTPPVNPPANSSGGGSRNDDGGRSPTAGLLDTEDHRDYLHGFRDGLFHPGASMTRAQAAQMFYNLLRNQDINGPSNFTDVPEGMWCYEAVSTLKTLGVMQGVTEDRFAPNRPITRAELVVTAVRFTEHRRGTASFTDVAETDWYYPEISAAASRGWIGGYPDGTFRPGIPITRAQAATVINRLLGRKADEDFLKSRPAGLQSFPDALPGYWAYEDIMEAANAHDYHAQGSGERWTALRRS